MGQQLTIEKKGIAANLSKYMGQHAITSRGKMCMPPGNKSVDEILFLLFPFPFRSSCSVAFPLPLSILLLALTGTLELGDITVALH